MIKALFIGFCIIFIGIILLLMSTSIDIPTHNKPLNVALSTVHFRGWDVTQNIWEVDAKKGTVPVNQDVFVLTTIRNGHIRSKTNGLSIDSLSATLLKVDQSQQTLQATSIQGILRSSQANALHIQATTLNYDAKTKLIVLQGAIKLAQTDFQIFTQELQFDSTSQKIEFHSPYKIIKKNSVITSNELIIDVQRNQADIPTRFMLTKQINDKPLLVKPQAKSTSTNLILQANSLHYNYGSASPVYTFREQIIITQPNKLFQGNFGKLTTTTLTLTQNVTYRISQGYWNTSAAKKARWLKKELTQDTLISMDRMQIDLANHNLVANGNLRVTQNTLTASSRHGFYSDKKGLLTLLDKVTIHKDQNYLICQKAIIDLKKNTFEAFSIEKALIIKR